MRATMLLSIFHKKSLSPEQRNLFNKSVRTEQLKSSRIFTAICLVFSLSFLYLDQHIFNDSFESIAQLRLLTIAVCLLGLWGTLYVGTSAAFSIITTGLVSYNLVIVYIGILASNLGSEIYQQGTVLIIIYCCTLFQASFFHSAFITIGCCLSYVFGITFYSTTDPSTVLNNAMIFFTAAGLGLLAVMQREASLVSYFLNSEVLTQQKKDAHKQALTDGLTGLPNRFAIMERLESYHGHIPENMLVIMADIDNFKKLNDKLGHKAGDIALQKVAATLEKVVVDKGGFIARYGGEEFLIFLERVSKKEALLLTDNILTKVRNISEVNLPMITLSLGAHISYVSDQSISECIEKSDSALLRAKSEGKDCVVFT